MLIHLDFLFIVLLTLFKKKKGRLEISRKSRQKNLHHSTESKLINTSSPSQACFNFYKSKHLPCFFSLLLN